MARAGGSYFDRVHLKNVRCFKDAEIPLDPRVTVIVGGNASGKTTLMESLASLVHGEAEGLSAFPLRYGESEGEIALYENGNSSAVAAWKSKPATRNRLPSDRYVFLYGRYRSVPTLEPPRSLTDVSYLDELSSHAAQSRSLTLTRPDNRLLQELPGYIRGLNFGRSADPRVEEMWNRLNQTLTRLDPKLSGIRMDPGPEHLVPKILRDGIALDLAELSDGYKALLVIVLDLMLRYAYLFLEGDPLAGAALVGIDEVDLHLHPRWQRTVLPELADLFPHTQFVITTHSPIVVQAAIDRNFTVLRKVEKDGGVTAGKVSAALMKRMHGAEVGSLLFEDHLFGVDSRFSVDYERIEQRVEELQILVAGGMATAADYEEFKQKVNTLEGLVAKEDRRRADGSTMAHMVRVQAEFVKALTDELKKARR